MHESQEMYLETILLIKNKKDYVRSVDIARELEFSKPSVSRAVGLLKQNGMIEVQSNGYIELTKLGLETAKKILEKHQILTKFLVEVAKVSEEVAANDACKIEHIISEESFEGIKKFLGGNK